MPKRIWLLMDARAHTDVDDAIVYSVSASLAEARGDRQECDEDGAAIVEADLVGNEYRNLRVVE